MRTRCSLCVVHHTYSRLAVLFPWPPRPTDCLPTRLPASKSSSTVVDGPPSIPVFLLWTLLPPPYRPRRPLVGRRTDWDTFVHRLYSPVFETQRKQKRQLSLSIVEVVLSKNFFPKGIWKRLLADGARAQTTVPGPLTFQKSSSARHFKPTIIISRTFFDIDSMLRHKMPTAPTTLSIELNNISGRTKAKENIKTKQETGSTIN